MTDRIICDCCGGSGRDTAGYNFINTGGACENCAGQGSWESEGTPVGQFNAAVDREIARQQLTERIEADLRFTIELQRKDAA